MEWISKFINGEHVELELEGVALEHIIAFLKTRGATHIQETWYPDLQYDEMELDGKRFCVIQETYRDPILTGPKDVVHRIRMQFEHWSDTP